MEFEIDFTGIPVESPLAFGWWLFINGGYIVVIIIGLILWYEMFLMNRRHKYEHAVDYILLAIDVPKATEQTPLPVENIFSSLAATYSTGTLWDRYWKGRIQESFSFELVSLGGYIQFLVRTPAIFRDLIEAAVYAQYPDAEVTQVEDYIDRIPVHYNTDAFDVWGTEFALMNKQCYPIKTYPEFEHTLSQSFKDPMAALLEVLGRIQPDEDVWLQLVVTPTDDHWKHGGKHEVKSIIEGKKENSGFLDWLIFKLPIQILDDIGEIIIPLWGNIEEEKKSESEPSVSKLTPGQKKIVEAIEHKMSKIGLYTKFRMIYWGRRETFLKGRGVQAVVGAIQQFTALDRNGYKPSKLMTTKADYFLKESRINKKQRRILNHYRTRNPHRGLGHGFILCTEELATLYHFPVVEVKAPLVKKTEAKKSEPPFALPTTGSYLKPVESVGVHTPEVSVKGGPPSNLPFVDE